MRTRLFVPVVLMMLIGCSSTSRRPTEVAKPDIDAYLAHELNFFGGDTGPADVTVEVRNRASVPITVRRIEITSPGMKDYQLDRAIREFHDTLAPGQTKMIIVPALARTQVSDPQEPLIIRAVLDMESAGRQWREVILSRQ